jgi:Putative glucoamylase
VTPHAAFLALRFAPEATLANLQRLAHAFPGLYGPWGFRDSVNVDTGVVSGSVLSLDQGMIMAAIGNALAGDMLRTAFVTPDFKSALRPVMGVEEFGAAPRGCTITGRAERDEGTRAARSSSADVARAPSIGVVEGVADTRPLGVRPVEESLARKPPH